MGDGYAASLSPRWRAGFVVVAVAVSAPMLLFDPVAVPPVVGRLLGGLLIVALAAGFWLLKDRPGLGAAVARERWGLAALRLGAVLLAWSWGALARARGARRVAERRQLVLEECARVARELHDVLSHTVSVMVVQAAAADDVFEVDPRRARQAVQRIEEAGRQALAELRWFLRSVRTEGEGIGGPLPTMADVDRLASGRSPGRGNRCSPTEPGL